MADTALTMTSNPPAPALVTTTSLLMTIEEARSEFLLQGFEIDHQSSDLWYIDIGATNHMTGQRSFFMNLDESKAGFVKFGDNS